MTDTANEVISQEKYGPMKVKTIEKICRGKIEDWIHSLPKTHDATEPKGYKEHSLAEVIRENAIVTGGAIASMLMGERVNDFDVYFRTKEAAVAVAEYYVKLFAENNKNWLGGKVSRLEVNTACSDRVVIHIKSQGVLAADKVNEPDEPPVTEVVVANEESRLPTVNRQMEVDLGGVAGGDPEYQYFEGTSGDEAEVFIKSLASRARDKRQKEVKYEPVFLTDNAITLSNQLQIVIRFFGEPDEIHGNYDYVHCMNYYTRKENKVVLKPEAMESLRTKDLKYIGSLYPICSLIRMRKFINRGWRINAGQIVKMAYQISKLNLDDISVMQEQLIGVDAAYFYELISLMKHDAANGKTIDQSYICQIIDQVFE